MLEWPQHLPRFWMNHLRGWLNLSNRPKTWGLHYPGIENDLGRLTPIEIAAKQWLIGVETAFEDLAMIPDSRRINIRYEDFVTAPQSEMERALEFVNLRSNEKLTKFLNTEINTEGINVFRSRLSDEQIRVIQPSVEPVANKFGYIDGVRDGA